MNAELARIACDIQQQLLGLPLLPADELRPLLQQFDLVGVEIHPVDHSRTMRFTDPSGFYVMAWYPVAGSEDLQGSPAAVIADHLDEFWATTPAPTNRSYTAALTGAWRAAGFPGPAVDRLVGALEAERERVAADLRDVLAVAADLGEDASEFQVTLDSLAPDAPARCYLRRD